MNANKSFSSPETLGGNFVYGVSSLEAMSGLWRSIDIVLDSSSCHSCEECSMMATADEYVCEGRDFYDCQDCNVCASACPVKAVTAARERELSLGAGKGVVAA